MKIKLIYLSFIFCTTLWSQKDSIKNYSNQIKITPLRLLNDLDYRGLEMSYERLHLHAFATQFSATWIFDPFKVTEHQQWKNLKGYAVGIQEKHFFRMKKHASDYIAADLVFASSTYEMRGIFGVRFPWGKDSSDQILDTVQVRRRTYTFGMRYGLQINRGHFVFDFNAGAGLRYRDVKHWDKLRPGDEMEGPRHPNLYYPFYAEGQYFVPELSASIKLGYRF